MEKMDDFDTSLLFPDVIMEVENDPITTRNESNLPGASDQTSSPFDFNITGCKAQFKLTEEEDQLRKITYTIDNPVQNSKIHCTSCNIHLGSALNNLKNVYVHPLLLVIICNDCFEFYSSDYFEKDEDGSEMFCRWCGQGGQVICCSGCPMVFCKLCIRINFSAAKYAEIRDKDEWKCFVCQPDQITALRVHCFEFAGYVRKEISRLTAVENKNWTMETDHTRCCLPTAIPNKRRTQVKDPDYVPSSTAVTERHFKAENINDEAMFDEEEVSDSKFESDELPNQSTPSAQMVVENDHPYCRPIAQKPPSTRTTGQTPAIALKNPRFLPKPPESNLPRLQVLQSAVPSSTGSVQFLVKQRSGPQLQPPQVGTSSTPSEQTGPPPPLLILTNLQSNSTVRLGVLKSGQKVILAPFASNQNKINNTSKAQIDSGGFQSGQAKPVPGERIQTGRDAPGAPTPPSLFQFGHRLPDENAQKEENRLNVKPVPTPPQLRKLPAFIVQTRKVPVQGVPENQESVELAAKLRLTEKAIREASLANGSFGASLIELQAAFSFAKFAQDYVKIHNSLQESLSTVMVRLLQANKEMNEGLRDLTGADMARQPLQQLQSSAPTCCPMGPNNCLRLSKFLGKNTSVGQKSQAGGNLE